MSYDHRCQHQRTKKRDREDEKASKAGVRHCSPPGGATDTAIHRHRLFPELHPGISLSRPYVARTESLLDKQAKHTTFYNFSERISFAEHWQLVAESSEFHMTLNRAHLDRILSNSKYAKKRDILSQKRESGMTLKKREFTPESGTVDTYV